MNSRVKHILFPLVLILLGCSITVAQTRISEKFDDKPLGEVLEYFAKSYKIKFAYDNSIVSLVRVSGDFQNKPIDEVLNIIFKNTNLEMLFINDVYIIKSKPIQPKDEPKIVAIKPVKYKVFGVVKEKGTGETLPYATISIAETPSGASANTDGFFSITSDKKDSLMLNISYLGFQPFQIKVAPQNKNEIITIELNRNSTAIPEVVVVNAQQDLFAADGLSVGTIQWNSKKNSDPPSISNLDIAAPLQLLPGIDGTTESLSGLLVRHSPADKNLFVYDGFTVYHIDHFFGAFTSFNAKAIKDIRVSRGGFDSRWGGRASSVIEITGKTGNENRLVVDVGTDQLCSDVEIEGPIGKKTTFVFAARRSFTDIYHSDLYYNLFESASSDMSATNNTPTSLKVDPDLPVYYFYDMNAKFSFKPSSKDVISISGYRGYDKMKLNETLTLSTVYEDSKWGNQGMGVRWSRQWNSNYYHSFTVGISEYDLDFEHSDYRLRRRMAGNIYDTITHNNFTQNNINDISLGFNNELKLGRFNTLEFGVAESLVEIDSKDGVSSYSFGNKVIDTLRIYDNKLNNLTLWAQNNISINNLESFKFGGRVTYNNLLNKYFFEPRVQLSLKLSASLTTKFSAGIYYQFVNKILTYSNGGYRNIWKVSDGKVFPVVKSEHLIGGFAWSIGGGFSLDVEGYKKYTDGISFEQVTTRKTASDKIVQSRRVLQMSCNAIGLDVLLKKNWSKGQSWVSYSLSRTLNKSENVNKDDEYPAFDDHLNELKIVNVLNLKHWNFTLAWIYGTGKPWDYIPFIANTIQVSPDYEKNAYQLEAYHRMDLSVSYNFKIAKGDFKIGAKVFNLYNRQNLMSKPYQLSDPFTITSPLVYSEIPGMGFTTSFFFNCRF